MTSTPDDDKTDSSKARSSTSGKADDGSCLATALILIGLGLYAAKVLLWKSMSVWALGPGGMGRETSASTFLRRVGFTYDQAHALDPTNSYVVLAAALLLAIGLIIGGYADRRVTLKNKQEKFEELIQPDDAVMSKAAIASVTLSVAGFLLPLMLQIGVNKAVSWFQWTFILILPIAGVVCGHVAKARVISKPMQVAGFGMAFRALIIGYGLLGVYFLLFLLDL